jgi:P27 family predicted phage terminase small subunit
MNERAPRHLSKEAKRIWRDVVSGWQMDARTLALLQVACESWDLMRECREKIDEAGLIIKSPTGQYRKNPACEVLKTAKDGFLRAWQALNLDVPPPKTH